MKRTDVVIYTCVTGGFDEVEAVPEDFPFRCILFTDNKSINVNGWEICLIDDKKKSPIHINRNLKIRMHPMIKEYKKSIYIDGNVIIKEESVEFFRFCIWHGLAPLNRERRRVPCEPGR